MAKTAKLSATRRRAAEAKLHAWRADPMLFFREALGVSAASIWPKVVEVAESVRDNIKTAVAAGHGVSKTWTAARLALWYLYCHPPATVITTAPTAKQVEELLWREIREAHTGARVALGGNLTNTKLDLQAETGQRWYALGFSTRPDTVTLEATAFQGYHNDHILVIFDEAAGIMPQIWRAAEHLLTSGHCRWLAIGNPTAPRGSFADAVGTWHSVNIAVLDTPNYQQGKEIIPGVSGREYVERVAEKYGELSNEYRIRVLGKLPEWSEGSFFGRELAKAEADGRVGIFPPEPAAQVYTCWDIGHTHTAIWFVQFVRRQLRIIDFYYDDKGLGLPAYAKVLQDKPYRYAQHIAPHDAIASNAKSIQTGRYLIDTARELGIEFSVLPRAQFVDRIAAGRDALRLACFDLEACKDGLTALAGYRQQLDATRSTDDKPVYRAEPVKDWTCHPADAWTYLAMAYRYNIVVDDHPVGYPGPLPAIEQMDDYDDRYDPLDHWRRRR